MADPMLSPRKGATELLTCPTHYLETHDFVEEIETLVRKSRANSMHRLQYCVHASF